MTRILILGSSHAGALKRADAAFRARHPGIETDFFVVKAPMLLRGRVESGVFRPLEHDDAEAETYRALNGRSEVDLTGYDKVLVIGFRARPTDIAELFETHAILGDPADLRPFRVSPGLVEDWLRRLAADWAANLRARFGDAPGCVFTVGPYPAESLVERADDLGMAARFRAFRDCPQAQGWFDLWAAAIAAEAAAAGYGHLAQPEDTTAGPFATRAEFAVGGINPSGDAMGQTDHRHMNADFGLRLLEAFARRYLDQDPPR